MRRRTLRRRGTTGRVRAHVLDGNAPGAVRSGDLAHRGGGDQRRDGVRRGRRIAEIAGEGGPALNLVEPMSSADSTTPGHIDFAASCSPSSAPVTAAPMTSVPSSRRISRVSLICLMSTTRIGRNHAGSELHSRSVPPASTRPLGPPPARSVTAPSTDSGASYRTYCLLRYRLEQGAVPARRHRCPGRPGEASASVSYSRSFLRIRECAPTPVPYHGRRPRAAITSEAARMYFDAPMRNGVRLSEAGAEAARGRTDRIRRDLVVRDRPRPVLSPPPGRARHRSTPDRDEYRGCVRPHSVLDGDQRMGSAVGERRPAAAGAGNAGAAARRTAVLRRVRTSGRTYRGLHRLPARHLEHVPDRSPTPVRRAVPSLHADQRLLQPGTHRQSRYPGLPRRSEPRMAAAAGEAPTGSTCIPCTHRTISARSSAPPSPRVRASAADRPMHTPW